MYDKVSKEITLQDGSKANIVVSQVIQVANSGYQYQYNGKEWQDELGLNVYDYGNRNYDAAIGRFFNMDRFSEKYYDKSNYSYAGNNPNLFIDVRGDSILIYSKKDKTNILYENGNLYSKNSNTGKWESYNGKNVKTDKNGNKKVTGYLGKVQNALDKIRTGGDAGKELVSDLQNSNNFIRISEGKNNAVGLSVDWTDSNSDAAGNTRPSYIGLAHELGHAHDALDGIVDMTTVIGKINGKKIFAAEYTAMHWENRVRADNGLSLRAYYGKDDSGNIVGRNFNTITGNSLYFTQQQLSPTIQWQSQIIDNRAQMAPTSVMINVPFKY
jgi:RHS repeat-associated protein